MDFRVPSFHVTPAVTRLIAAGLGIALLSWAGVRAARAGDSLRAELRRAETTLATFADWNRRYQPAVAAESISWRRTLMELQDLGIVGDERLALTQGVARAAEFAGLRDVRVMIVEPDTTGSDARLFTEGVRREAAPFGLVVECRGNLQELVSFLGELPASVAPTDLSLARQNGQARHRLTLAVYQLQFLNVPPSHSTSLERGDPGRVSVDRSGG